MPLPERLCVLTLLEPGSVGHPETRGHPFFSNFRDRYKGSRATGGAPCGPCPAAGVLTDRN